MHRTTLLSLALCASGCATAGTTTFYPLDELKALDTPDDRVELLARATEVAPSKRNDEWRGLVERAAMATLDATEVRTEADAERALALVDDQPQRFPFLKRSAPWLGKRADLGVKALARVSQRGERGAWQRRLLDFARADAVTKGLAQRLANDVLLQQLIASTAVPLYQLAFEREGAAVCASPTVTRIAVELAEDGSVFTPANELCWKELAAPLLQAAKGATTHTAKLNVCKALAAHAAEPEVKAACPAEP